MKNMRLGCLQFILYLSCLLFPWNLLAEVTVDPHGQEGMCHYCHKSKVVEKGKSGFRLTTVEATCLECHEKRGATLKNYLQRMMPEVESKKKIIGYFMKQADFSCSTCHHVMCQSNSRKELQLRNPHIQLGSDGKIIERACLFCHTIVPDYKHPNFKNAAMRYDISYLCSLCHVMATEKRGLGFGKRMTNAMIQYKEGFEKKHDVVLPLGPNDTVTCASCHNPHQQGVILGKGGYAQAPRDHRLVLDDPYQLCAACHVGKY